MRLTERQIAVLHALGRRSFLCHVLAVDIASALGELRDFRDEAVAAKTTLHELRDRGLVTYDWGWRFTDAGRDALAENAAPVSSPGSGEGGAR